MLSFKHWFRLLYDIIEITIFIFFRCKHPSNVSEGGTRACGCFPWDTAGCMERLDRSDGSIHPIRMQKYTPPLTGQILLKAIYTSIFYALFMIPVKHILFLLFTYWFKNNKSKRKYLIQENDVIKFNSQCLTKRFRSIPQTCDPIPTLVFAISQKCDLFPCTEY